MSIINERGQDITSGAGLNVYEADWYSGSQIQVLMGDILIDNAVAISYQVRGDRIPVYGFASEYFTFAAKSPVLITGQLTIAFKESFYLLAPAARFHNRAQAPDNRLTTPKNRPNNRPGFQSLEAAAAAARRDDIRYRNIEQTFQAVEFAKEGKEPPPAGLIKELGALEDSAWEHLAERFEDSIWYGSDVQSPNTRRELFSRTMSDFETEKIELNEVMKHRRLDQYPAVDIWITYGDMEAPDTVNHTVQKLLDVYFTGEVKEITISGEPVFETYTFIARNRV